jgi:quinol monooxygenase YgiN
LRRSVASPLHDGGISTGPWIAVWLAGRVTTASAIKAPHMIHVLAFVTAKPGQRGALLAAFHENMPAVHAEAGCIEYAPVVDEPDFGSLQTPLGADTFVVVEKWESAAALRAHAAAPHMAAYGARTKDMIAKRAIHVLTDG